MPDVVNIGEVAVPGTYFLLKKQNHRFDGFKTPRVDASKDLSLVYTYTRHVDPTLKKALLSMIRGARNKIFLASFLLGDNEVLEELVKAAERLMGGVYVITAIDDSSLRRGTEEYDPEDQPDDMDAATRKKQLDGLTRKGIYVRGHSSCHAKFLVVDDFISMVSTANFEKNALSKNCECALIVRKPEEIQRLSRFFGSLWFEGCDFELLPSSGTYSVADRQGHPPPFTVLPPAKTTSDGAIWTNGENHSLLTHIQHTISSARRTLLLASWSLKGMREHPSLILEPLGEALEKNKGLLVKLLIRGRNNDPEQRETAKLLSDMGVRVFPHSWNHAKCAIADAREGCIFSANFDAAHGLTNGVEVGYRTSGKSLLQISEFFEHAMENADRTVVTDPTQSEINERMGMTWCEKWPLPHHMQVSSSRSDWDLFRKAVQSAPVLFEQEKEGSEVLLYLGELSFRLRKKKKEPDSLSYQLKLRQPHETSAQQSFDMLLKWMRTPHGPNRGFCPAVMVRTLGK